MFVYVDICICIGIPTDGRPALWVGVYVCALMEMCVCVCVCVCVYMRVFKYVYKSAGMCTYGCERVCVCVCVTVYYIITSF